MRYQFFYLGVLVLNPLHAVVILSLNLLMSGRGKIFLDASEVFVHCKRNH